MGHSPSSPIMKNICQNVRNTTPSTQQNNTYYEADNDSILLPHYKKTSW